MSRGQFIVLLCIALAVPAWADTSSVVADFGPVDGVLILTPSSTASWPPDTELCVFESSGAEAGCGKVTKVSDSSLELTLDSSKTVIQLGDRVAPRGSVLAATSEVAAVEEEEGEFENDDMVNAAPEKPLEQPGLLKTRTEFEDPDDEGDTRNRDEYLHHSAEERERIALIRYHRELILAGYQDSDYNDSNASLTRADKTWLVSAGLLTFGENTGSSIAPSFTVNYALNRHYTIGAFVAPQQFGIGTLQFSLLTIGGLVSYYPMETYSGVMGTIGVGVGPASGTVFGGGVYTGGFSWNILLTAGWRWKAADSFTISAQFGLQYVGVKGGTIGINSNLSTYSAIFPLGYIDIGFSFL